MKQTEYTIECPYRKQKNGQAICDFLVNFARPRHSTTFAVSSKQCHFCQKWHCPSNESLNPVVAAILYRACQEAIQNGEAEFESPHDLKSTARCWIPVESDCIPIHEEVHRQRNLDIGSIEKLIPRPQECRFGNPVKQWATGITTAPRKQDTLHHCLETMADAGWPAPRLFADGDLEIGHLQSGLEITHHRPKVGAWSNWYLALTELLMRSPQAEAFLLVQDDVIFYRHRLLRHYLESLLWPTRGPCIISLFCSRAYTAKENGWTKLDQALGWGGQALIFSRDACLAFLSDPWVLRHRLSPHGHAAIDSVVGSWAEQHQVPVYVPTPSLTQHIGQVSAIWPQNTPAFLNRRAQIFAGSTDLE